MKKLVLVLMVALMSSALFAQNELFLKKEFVFKGDTLRYRVLYPVNYDPAQKYPLVLFLHGMGERGSDNEKQLTHGAALFANDKNRLDFPSIVLFPQCPLSDTWISFQERQGNTIEFSEKPPITKSLMLVKKLLDSYVKNEGVDKKKIYVTGLSMGGMGTFDLICCYPKYFAAAMPICGGVYVDRLKKVKKMPIRIFHGGADPVVSREHSRNAFIELKAEGSSRVEYVEFPGVGHDSWTNAFEYPDFLSWMYYHSR